MSVTQIRTPEPGRTSARSAPVRIVRDELPIASASVRVATRASAGTHYAKYRYLVGDDVAIQSDLRLPELEYFRVGKLEHACHIEIRRGMVGRRRPRSRALLTQFHSPAALRYEEHLGALGANFSIDLGDPIRVTVGPLLAASPHVLYTNVVEALLRFVFVSRGRMLLHSACLELNDVGVMLSAKTDTGKTGTVLRLLREQGGRFLSDDMTILDEAGTAWCYPKPLTISAHTLRAVDAQGLDPLRWALLNVQGRIHSKSGRSVGLGMGEMNLPIMSANSLVQMIVPPPKFNVDRLVPCTLTDSVRVTEMFIIERGRPTLSDVSAADALPELLENTDDAYGFPPFRYFAPALVIGGDEYESLRMREQEILAAALRQIRVRRMASDTFGWADEIPQLLRTRRRKTTSTVSGSSVDG